MIPVHCKSHYVFFRHLRQLPGNYAFQIYEPLHISNVMSIANEIKPSYTCDSVYWLTIWTRCSLHPLASWSSSLGPSIQSQPRIMSALRRLFLPLTPFPPLSFIFIQSKSRSPRFFAIVLCRFIFSACYCTCRLKSWSFSIRSSTFGSRSNKIISKSYHSMLLPWAQLRESAR